MSVFLPGEEVPQDTLPLCRLARGSLNRPTRHAFKRDSKASTFPIFHIFQWFPMVCLRHMFTSFTLKEVNPEHLTPESADVRVDVIMRTLRDYKSSRRRHHRRASADERPCSDWASKVVKPDIIGVSEAGWTRETQRE